MPAGSGVISFSLAALPEVADVNGLFNDGELYLAVGPNNLMFVGIQHHGRRDATPCFQADFTVRSHQADTVDWRDEIPRCPSGQATIRLAVAYQNPDQRPRRRQYALLADLLFSAVGTGNLEFPGTRAFQIRKGSAAPL